MSVVLVTGASGHLGGRVVAALVNAGHHVRALTRRPASLHRLSTPPQEAAHGDLTAPHTLAGICDGVDAVIACGGASMRLGGFADRASFDAVDYHGNGNLLAVAREAAVRRFVYVSVAGADALRRCPYVDAHERFAERLCESGLRHAVVRPTGYFAFFADVLRHAARGRAVVIGDGSARTNPVHEADVAEACVRALDDAAPQSIAIGGPDVLTRHEIVLLAQGAVGRRSPVRRVSPAAARAVAAPLRLLNPRLHALVDFGTEVSLTDVVAPAEGRRRLVDYFAAGARELHPPESHAPDAARRAAAAAVN